MRNWAQRADEHNAYSAQKGVFRARPPGVNVMGIREQDRERLLATVFSDETALFRTPAEPDVGDMVTVRLRMARGLGAHVALLLGYGAQEVDMALIRTDDAFDWFEARLECRWSAGVFYSFLIRWQGLMFHYLRTGAEPVEALTFPDPDRSFRILPGYHVPHWAKGAVQYQIFTDRFCNGDPTNDVTPGEYRYGRAPAGVAASWDELPSDGDFHRFYGGDLAGVRQKLDYLQSLGVEAIYFNPLFISPSSHKYDTQDYDHIDPHFTVIPHDATGAERYRVRTTDPANLKAGDDFFADFCREVHRRGMRIILDGVFNHCGSFHRWMDREGLYGGQGAFASAASPYHNFFRFDCNGKYEAWWGVDTLPKLNYEGDAALCEAIYRVAEKWASPPYAIDGWRLDVAADLGHSRAFNHMFWKEFRRRVKAVNDQVLIVAEHYGDPSEWLGGDEWDTVMNYDAFMEPVGYFLTGVEKHSDQRRDDLHQNGPAFFRAMAENMSRLPTPAIQCAMNELSNHDHSRFLTRTNGRIGRLTTAGSAAAGEGVNKAVFREAAVIQMTWPGAPTIYYGDEAGVVGWTDPDNRRTYPWGREDRDMIAFHRALTALRRRLPTLREGSVKPLCADTGTIAYARFDRASTVVVACNNLDEARELTIPVGDVGVADGQSLRCVFTSDHSGFRAEETAAPAVKDGLLTLRAPARSAWVLTTK